MTNDFREKTRAAAAFALCLLLTACTAQNATETQAESVQMIENNMSAEKEDEKQKSTSSESEATEIQVYEETLGFWEKPCTTEETETQLEKLLYDNEEEQENARPLRRMTLQKDSGMLEIWDYRYDRSIFSGKATLKEDGSLANAEYYDYLFADSLYGYYHSESDSAISNRETFLA